ncbi:hypothetical protein [Caballeronia arvi]|uniref:hypothetical protein n=1 Tax=Caballeronia arvi TaxID=1777135 RepID=UPI00117CF107|nr:hypothetical protein [Caballeronia arvi]
MMLRRRIPFVFMVSNACLLFAATCVTALADEDTRQGQEPGHVQGAAKAPSPWVLLPTFSNNPKLGTAFGGLGAYVRKFDDQSQVSMFGVTAQYTSANSAVAAIFARTSFAGDQHRISVLAAGGIVKNDYDNFLGTGTPVKSDDHLRALVGRYLYRLKNDWFGAQAVFTNYQIVGQTS